MALSKRLSCALVPVILLGVSSCLWAALDWQAQVLGPGRAWGGGVETQVGWLDTRAAAWGGTNGSFVDLAPAGSVLSYVRDADGGTQVGTAGWHDDMRAIVWHGTAASYDDITPNGWIGGELYGISGQQIVGAVWNNHSDTNGAPLERAGLWNTSVATFVNLHPSGYDTSIAVATDGARQAGVARIDGNEHAALWNGSAGVFVDLTPSSNNSQALGIAGSEQVGFDNNQAVLWHGTPQSRLKLMAADAGLSACTSTIGGYEAGWVYRPEGQFGAGYAVFWSGTADSAQDLHAFLPAGYVRSEAISIARAGDQLQIAGTAYRNDGTSDVVLWTATIPEPAPNLLSAASIVLLASGSRRSVRGLTNDFA